MRLIAIHSPEVLHCAVGFVPVVHEVEFVAYRLDSQGQTPHTVIGVAVEPRVRAASQGIVLVLVLSHILQTQETVA